MRRFILIALCLALATLLSAQPASTFFSTFDAERGNVLAPASGGSLWLGGMKNGRVLLTKLSTDGKALSKHSIDFEGLDFDNENLVDLLEETDGTLVGCGNFEDDSQGRGFVFRYDPAAKTVVWAHIVRSGGLNYLFGITQLGTGGDYVLYGNPHFAGGDDAELLRLSRATGQIVAGQAKRLSVGPSDNITQAVYHNGALYTCGRFTGTEPFPDARMRNAICKIDPATLEPLWTRLGPLPTSSSGRFYGRDLIIDNGAILSTFSGDHTGPVLTKSEVYLQKNDLDGTPLWIRQYKLPAFKGEFAEEIISLPDGYMLYGYDFLTDTSRLFLLKTDKEGELITAAKIDFGHNDEVPKIPARSKILRVGDALFLTALSENNLGQSQGILIKTDLNGWLGDSCGFVKKTPATFATWEPNVSQLLVPTVTASPATIEANTTSVSTPSLTFSRKCGAADMTCAVLPDLRLTLDSVSCANGEPLLHYTFCNVGGQTYEGSAILGLYDKNPLTESAKLVTLISHTVNTLAPGERVSGVVASNPLPPMPFLLNTFSVLYGLMGVNLAATTPVLLSSFPFPPNSPECGYANNLDSFEVKNPLCAPDSCHPNTFWKIFGRQGNWINISALRAAPDGNLYMAGRKDDRLAICKMAPDGQFLWTRSLAFAPLQRMLIEEIIVDSEGMIVGSGNLADVSTAADKGVFAFRYNPTTDQVLWAQHFSAFRSTEGGILEKTPGGNFLLHYNPSIVGTDAKRAEILELDRATGQIVPAFAKRYEYQYSQAFSNVVAHDGAIYATGYTIRKVGNISFRRMVMSKLDASTGDVIWSRTGLTDWPQNSDFIGGDLIVDDNSLLALYYGNETGNAVGNAIKLYLQKTTLDGEVLWVKKYDLAAFPKELVATPDGYVIFAGDFRRTFLKTDKEGNLLVSKRLDSQAYFIGSAGIGEQNQVERIGQHLYFAHETARNNQIYGYTTLLKTDLNLEMEFDCAFSPFPITYSSVAVKPNIEAPQTVTASPSVQEAVVTALSPDVIVLHKSCPTCATESCTDLPDITAHIDSITCSPTQGAVAHIRVCNLGQTTPAAGFHLTFYGKNPLVSNAVRLQSVFLQEMPAPGQCLQTVLPLNALLLQFPKVYTLAGVDGNVQPPIALDVFPFVNGYTECDYANNLDSFEVKLPDLKKPNLGPDRSICTGQTTTLDAGNGYATYQWLNGPATQTYTVAATGNYIAEVTDECGNQQRDTVQILVLPYPKRTVKAVLLPGDSVTILGKTYFGTTTILDTIPTLTGLCDTVVTYNIRLDSLHCEKTESFLKIYEASTGRALLAASDGSVYIAGENPDGTLLSKSDASGNLMWTRQIFDAKQTMVFIYALIEDSEGMLVGCGNRMSGGAGADRMFAFRYDPAANQVLWFKEITPPEVGRATNILEKEAGGDYLLCQSHAVSGGIQTFFASEIWRLDRATGTLVGGKVWCYDSNVSITAAKMHQGALYATGLVEDASAPDNRRYGVMRIDPNTGAIVWVQKTIGSNVGDVGRDLLVDTDGNIVTLTGASGIFWLQKTSPNGNLLWWRKYEIVSPLDGPYGSAAIKLLKDGSYVVSSIANDLVLGGAFRALAYMKIDQNGTVLWGKRVSEVIGTFGMGPQSLAVQGNNTYFTWGTTSASLMLSGTLFGKFDRDGNIGENCGAVQDLTATFTPENATQATVSLDFNNPVRTLTAPVISPPVALKLLPYTRCSKCPSPCDSVAVTKTIQFYPGDTITIDGKAYTQSGTVVQNFTTPAGCDSVVTNILQLVITEVKITCPNNLTVTLPPNQTSTVVDYSLPTVTTNCPDSTIKLTLLQGLPVGGNFPQGTTQVCYEAANQCGIRDTCCFSITAQQPDPPCDVKIPVGCVRYELLGIQLDALDQPRYRVRMTNTCASPLEFAYIQLPNGVLAVSPKEGATYTAPGSNTYAVRNPNASPFYSVRYKAVTGSLNNGKNDVFEYALPQQSAPAYIRVAARLADGSYSEAHLNTYNCPVLPSGIENLEFRMENFPRSSSFAQFSILNSPLLVRPNPTDGLLFVDLRPWQGQQVQLRVLNAQGQLVLERGYTVEGEEVGMDLPAGLASGLYYLVVQPEGGEDASGRRPSQAAARFVLER